MATKKQLITALTMNTNTLQIRLEKTIQDANEIRLQISNYRNLIRELRKTQFKGKDHFRELRKCKKD